MFGKLALKTALGALRGGGRMVQVHLIPDNITPWQARKTITKTSSSFLNSVLKELKSSRKAKQTKRTPQRSTKAQKPSVRPTYSPKVSGRVASPRLSTYNVNAPARSAAVPAQLLVTHSVHRVPATPRANAVRPKVADEPVFYKNGWSRGDSLKSATDWNSRGDRLSVLPSRHYRAANSQTGTERVAMRRAHAKKKRSAR